MIKHPDIEVQSLVEMLEGQRDSAMAQAASLYKLINDLQVQVKELLNKEAQDATNQVNDAKGNE
jgi:hypothetical protein